VYLYVAFDDTWGAWHDVNMGFSGCGTSYRRIKKIKLTEEQIKQLQPRQVGESGGKPTIRKCIRSMLTRRIEWRDYR
jgi:hypothetical protein